MKKKFRIAAMNATPVFMDLDATVSKAVDIIEQAAKEGAELIGFPEAFFPGYPIWLWVSGSNCWDKFTALLWKNAVTIPGPAVSRLSEAARKNNMYVCASVTELDGHSLYLTQLWFDRNGNLIGKHRKIRPTGTERCLWGEGDGSTMAVFETDLGRVGGLHCWEHMMPINHMAMAAQCEEIHVASWGSSFYDPQSAHHFDTYRIATAYYSMAVGCYSILSATPMTDEILEFVSEGDPAKKNLFQPGFGGGGCIYSPEGRVIATPPDPHKEGLVVAEVDMDALPLHHYQLDIAGHYSKPGVYNINFDRRPQRPVNFIGDVTDYSLPYEVLQNKGTDAAL